MTMISIEPFVADFESTDDNGKRHRHQCTVVGIKEADWQNKFVVIAQGEDGRFGTFDIENVWPCGPAA